MELDQLETMARILDRIAATYRDVRLAFNFIEGPKRRGDTSRVLIVDLYRGTQEWHVHLVLPDNVEDRAMRLQYTLREIELYLSKAGID